MNRALLLLTGIGVGAAVMYLLDPDGGGGRRAMIRDKAIGIGNDVSDAMRKTTTDLGNRAQGLLHDAKDMIGTSGEDLGQVQPEGNSEWNSAA